jgi:hypothetical protein
MILDPSNPLDPARLETACCWTVLEHLILRTAFVLDHG